MPATASRVANLWKPSRYERVISTLSSKEPPQTVTVDAQQAKRKSGFLKRMGTFGRAKDDELTVVESPASYFSGAMDRLCGPVQGVGSYDENSLNGSASSGSREDTIVDWWNQQDNSYEEDEVSKSEGIEVVGGQQEKNTKHIEEQPLPLEPVVEEEEEQPQKVKVKTKRPSIYEDAFEMLTQSILIYTFADLQNMAREEGFPSSSKYMQYPIAFRQIAEDIRDHGEDLEARAISSDRNTALKARLEALRDLQTQQQQKASTSKMMGRILRGGASSSSKLNEPVLTHFYDEVSTQGMVYGIAVNPAMRRITVIFRGSVRAEDFITDVKFSQKKLDNPAVALSPDAPKTINIHKGFYEYLFQEDDEGKVQMDHVLDNVKKLLKKYRGYQLFCTGHSLGGALATLCGFFAAMDDQIVKNGPVCVYSWASPRVGNFGFRASYNILERMNRLQHLRITNKEDLATLLPFMAIEKLSSSRDIVPGGISLYKHCGIHLKFKPTLANNPPLSDLNDDEAGVDPNDYFRLSYAKERDDEYEGVDPDELQRAVVVGRTLSNSFLQKSITADFKPLTGPHSCDEYERRLIASRTFFDATTLDQLYADESLVGTTAVANPSLNKTPAKAGTKAAVKAAAKTPIQFLPKREETSNTFYV